MNVELVLKDNREKLSEIVKNDYITWESSLYNKVTTNNDLHYIFAALHHEMNYLFDFMTKKSKSNSHFNAEQSRELIGVYHIYVNCEKFLKNTKYAFELDNDYLKQLEYCMTFLKSSEGSDIPDKYSEISINKYEPIFKLSKNNYNHRLKKAKQLGEGAFAKTYIYKDSLYNCKVVLKELKKNVSETDKKRFVQEFNNMKECNSPYILKVYKINTDNMSYTMEYAPNGTLEKFLYKHPSLSIHKRRSMALQFIKGMKYIHSKRDLHRDISYKNVLVFKYDDAIIVKISDFGLIKTPSSELTKTDSSMKGTILDPVLVKDSFKNYNMKNEIYAMTKLIYFIMTNRKNLDNINNPSVRKFVEKGTSYENYDKRYNNDHELLKAFKETKWSSK